MVQKDITLKLRDDCITILEIADAWPEAKGDTWKVKQSKMAEIMRDKLKCEELVQRIYEIAMGGTISKILSEEYIRGCAKLLQYRIDANDLSVDDDGDDGETAGSSGRRYAPWKCSIDAALKSMELTDKTVIGFKMVQEVADGNKEKMAQILEEASGTGRKVKIEEVVLTPTELREKMNYMNHRIWLMEPSLPVYVVYYVDSDKAATVEKTACDR